GDLIDRALIHRLPRIDEDRRRTEADFWAEFEAARPRIVGALLTAVAVALSRVDTVRLSKLPRLADFAVWVEAAAPALGWAVGEFLTAFNRNRDEGIQMALDADPVSGPLQQFAGELAESWEGQAADLLERLEAKAGEKVTKRKDWPKNARALSGR